MALQKSLTAFGATFPDAYHKIEETLLKKMEFDGGPALGAKITVFSWTSKAAKDAGESPVSTAEEIVKVPANTASAIVPLAYGLLLTTEAFSGATSV